MKAVTKKIKEINNLYKEYEHVKAVLRANLKWLDKEQLKVDNDPLITNLQRRVTTLERQLKELVK